TEGEITLNKDTNPIQTTAKALGINTELDKANKQVEAPKDINKVLKEQQILSQEAGNVAGAVMTYAGRQAAELEEKQNKQSKRQRKRLKKATLLLQPKKPKKLPLTNKLQKNGKRVVTRNRRQPQSLRH
ncbi:hypothetical protein, partial [Histophilus somni]